MVKLIRSLGFFNAILDILFIALGIVALLLRGFARDMTGFLPPGTVNMIIMLITYTGWILIFSFSLGLIFSILVLIRSFQKGK